MALTISFGNGGNAAATVIDQSFLNGPIVKENVLPDGGDVPAGSYDVAPINVPGSGTGGSVLVSFSDEDNAYVFDTTWNGVKDAKVVSNTAENVKLVDFVHADIDLGSSTKIGGTGSFVELDNLKRGNVTTGNGSDSINISLSTNNAGWQNTVNVNSGAGDDTITISAGQVSGAAAVTNGSLTTVTINAGAGNDTIDLSGVALKASFVTGGAGSDTMTASGGADTFIYGASPNGIDTIFGFNASQDKLQLNDGVTATYTADLTENGPGVLATLFSNGAVVGNIHLVGAVLAA